MGKGEAKLTSPFLSNQHKFSLDKTQTALH